MLFLRQQGEVAVVGGESGIVHRKCLLVNGNSFLEERLRLVSAALVTIPRRRDCCGGSESGIVRRACLLDGMMSLFELLIRDLAAQSFQLCREAIELSYSLFITVLKVSKLSLDSL